jgi:hypothetical protein
MPCQVAKRPKICHTCGCISRIYSELYMVNLIKRSIALLTIVSFSLSLLPFQTLAFAQMSPVLNLPLPGTMVIPTATYHPMMIRGLSIYPDNPLKFDFIVDSGEEPMEGAALKEESEKLVKYFLASLTIQEDEMWVNLSPYEKNRIIPGSFGKTEMGRDLLAQDYILKQLTASLMNPDADLGNTFWKRVYQRAQEKYGTTNVPMDTFNKVWIIPDQADVFINPERVEGKNNVFVVNAHLKVLLEEDYLALESNVGSTRHGLGNVQPQDLKKVSAVSSQVIREIILPEIEREVNEGKTFAKLRQIYNTLILAAWYKKNLKNSLLGQVYIDQGKTKGVETDDPAINQKIYEQYLKAFQQGAYDLIKEDYDPASQEVISRKYFSGGVLLNASSKLQEKSQLAKSIVNTFIGAALSLSVTLTNVGNIQAADIPSAVSVNRPAVSEIYQNFTVRQAINSRDVYQNLIKAIQNALRQPGNQDTNEALNKTLQYMNEHFDQQKGLALAEVADLLNKADQDDARMGEVNNALDQVTGIYFLKPFNPDQPTMLFIHGANNDPFDNWQKAFDRFGNDYNVPFVVYNQFDDFITLSQRIAVQIKLMKSSLRIPKIELVGFSTGSVMIRGFDDIDPQTIQGDIVVTTGEPAGGFWRASFLSYKSFKKVLGLFVRKDKLEFADFFNPFGDIMTRLYSAKTDKEFREAVNYTPIQIEGDEFSMLRSDNINIAFSFLLWKTPHTVSEALDRNARGRGSNVLPGSMAGDAAFIHGALPTLEPVLDIIEKEAEGLKEVPLIQSKADPSLLVESNPGGIDFNPANLKLNAEGQMIEMTVPENLKSLQGSSVEGFLPVINQITPITNLPFLIGKLEDSPSIVSSD